MYADTNGILIIRFSVLTCLVPVVFTRVLLFALMVSTCQAFTLIICSDTTLFIHQGDRCLTIIDLINNIITNKRKPIIKIWNSRYHYAPTKETKHFNIIWYLVRVWIHVNISSIVNWLITFLDLFFGTIGILQQHLYHC
jgi:hypothetical protein